MTETTPFVVNSVTSERREPCEWLDLKSRAEEAKYRQLSADLERRRIRKYNIHLEERKKVQKELNDLQKDRQRFEREKQLRRKKSFSSTKKDASQLENSQKTQKKNDFPIKEDALGGSASIAFDPKIIRRRRKTKTFMCCFVVSIDPQ